MTQIATLSMRQPLDSLAAGLGRSFAETGFAIVRDHGISPEAIARADAAMRAFFALPEPAKQAYRIAGQGGARGYTPFGAEHAKDAAVHDLKEFWHVGRELPEGDPLARYMPENVWPVEVPDFRPASLALFAEFEKAGGHLLEAIAVALGQEPEFFAASVDQGNSVLRYLHYPPVAAAREGAVRAAAHEDINTITLLLGAEEAGLELLTRDGKWLAVSPPEGALVVNVGDMLQRLTAGRLRSTTHRVVNPVGEAAGRSRYSMPFFLHFRPDYVITPLGEGGEEPITADAYLQQRLREIGLV
ncbi:isopenicillin N synthase family dioxygenase [Aurantiacibacter suaedae]|uniref:isopenicillin N synthase family dioxygenase n=1 Tax=Aurantiacibacter suaedae TaxID=2545755 RepID=UPI0010F9DD89|nr:2-oxoglutarate and iron-dependent oxygenase domain-containing protein [Aurantiacibacter suaedae]